MLRTTKSTVMSILLCLALSVSLFAQTPTAVVTGTVLDTSGATVPDAAVKVVNQDTNVVSARNTNNAGVFTIVNLLPGRYALTVSKSGFKTTALPVFELQVNQTLNQSITMQVGAVTETVEVSASSVAATIQSASTELGTT